MTVDKTRRLGRGLEALISIAGSPAQASELQRISIDRIKPNPYQPRRNFSVEELADLESSLRVNGLLQPITLRTAGQSYEIIAGERRLRAAANLGWKEIPAIVRNFDDQTALVLALVENLQRTDLNAIEEAHGYQRLVEDFGLTQQAVAEAVGKDRSTIANLLRMLVLPEHVLRMVEAGRISAGHARALLSLRSARAMIDLANEITTKNLSVRETEQHVRTALSRAETSTLLVDVTAFQPPTPVSRSKAASVKAVEDELRQYFQTDVQIALTAAEKGTVRLSFYSPDDLDRLLNLMLPDRARDF